ncbi:uncharacterized protein LOC124144892 [Haliotis rufescens]|uniref:uncharacterized protein LOC124144892 n=1 Tax=Haliotis rufescens TaxID=6454 RepID=UPI00201EF1A0|nr:uncharacterized protein LOC124144892 [Haliotis rufescens]
MYPKKMMRLEIMLCLQLLSALTTGSKSTFELLARRKHDFSMYLFKKAEMMSTRVDACAVNCARNPRCSVFKCDMLASLCTTFAPDRFRQASTGDLEAQLGYYAYTDREIYVFNLAVSAMINLIKGIYSNDLN